MFSKEKAMKAEQMRRYLNTPLCHSCQYIYGKQQAFHDLHKWLSCILLVLLQHTWHSTHLACNQQGSDHTERTRMLRRGRSTGKSCTFDRHNCTDVTCEVMSLTDTPRASAALKTLAPSRWIGMPYRGRLSPWNAMTQGSEEVYICIKNAFRDSKELHPEKEYWIQPYHRLAASHYYRYLPDISSSNLPKFLIKKRVKRCIRQCLENCIEMDLYIARQQCSAPLLRASEKIFLYSPRCQPTAWPCACTPAKEPSPRTYFECSRDRGKLFVENAHPLAYKFSAFNHLHFYPHLTQC